MSEEEIVCIVLIIAVGAIGAMYAKMLLICRDVQLERLDKVKGSLETMYQTYCRITSNPVKEKDFTFSHFRIAMDLYKLDNHGIQP